jgi:hypothetical protein
LGVFRVSFKTTPPPNYNHAPAFDGDGPSPSNASVNGEGAIDEVEFFDANSGGAFGSGGGGGGGVDTAVAVGTDARDSGENYDGDLQLSDSAKKALSESTPVNVEDCVVSCA